MAGLCSELFNLNKKIEEGVMGGSLMGVAQKIYGLIEANRGDDYSGWKFARAWRAGLGSDTIETFYNSCKEIIDDELIVSMCDAGPFTYPVRAARPPVGPPSARLLATAKLLVQADSKLSGARKEKILEMVRTSSMHAEDTIKMYTLKMYTKTQASPLLAESEDDEEVVTEVDPFAGFDPVVSD